MCQIVANVQHQSNIWRRASEIVVKDPTKLLEKVVSPDSLFGEKGVPALKKGYTVSLTYASASFTDLPGSKG